MLAAGDRNEPHPWRLGYSAHRLLGQTLEGRHPPKRPRQQAGLPWQTRETQAPHLPEYAPVAAGAYSASRGVCEPQRHRPGGACLGIGPPASLVGTPACTADQEVVPEERADAPPNGQPSQAHTPLERPLPISGTHLRRSAYATPWSSERSSCPPEQSLAICRTSGASTYATPSSHRERDSPSPAAPCELPTRPFASDHVDGGH